MYDLIVLGGGPAGYRAAERAGAEGMKTLVIEKRALGGVCLNEGCIPSKTLLNSAKIYDYANGYGEKYGVSTTGAKLDHAFVVNRKNKVVKTLVGGIGMAMKKYKVEVVYAEGKICGRTANGFSVEAEGKTYETAKLLIATGSSHPRPARGSFRRPCADQPRDSRPGPCARESLRHRRRRHRPGNGLLLLLRRQPHRNR